MIPREDGKRFKVQSHVNPDLCVGCGICTGACDSEAINLPIFESRTVRKTLEGWVAAEKAKDGRPMVAFCCGNSAGLMIRELPGYRIERVPCAGAVSAVMLERLLMAGAEGIVVIGCGESDPVSREGVTWFAQRMAGAREPRFDARKADPGRVHFIRADRTDPHRVLKEAAAFREQRQNGPAALRSRTVQLLGGMIVAVALCAVAWLFSDLTYRTPHSPQPELVVSFNHSGAVLEPKKLSKEELAKRLPHMRAQVNVSRQRVPVRLRVTVDGAGVLDHAYTPKGISKDGPSIAVARIPVAAGKHQVTVELADGPAPDEFTKRFSQQIDFTENRSAVVLFDSKSGFSLH
jgi:coenzyme F420-reducing hydrogenase delta subunit